MALSITHLVIDVVVVKALQVEVLRLRLLDKKPELLVPHRVAVGLDNLGPLVMPASKVLPTACVLPSNSCMLVSVHQSCCWQKHHAAYER